MDAYWSRLVPPTGTKGSPDWALRTAHVEAHQSRFWIEPGLKGGGISTDTLVPVQEPGLKALTNRDYRPFFYQWSDVTPDLNATSASRFVTAAVSQNP